MAASIGPAIHMQCDGHYTNAVRATTQIYKPWGWWQVPHGGRAGDGTGSARAQTSPDGSRCPSATRTFASDPRGNVSLRPRSEPRRASPRTFTSACNVEGSLAPSDGKSVGEDVDVGGRHACGGIAKALSHRGCSDRRRGLPICCEGSAADENTGTDRGDGADLRSQRPAIPTIARNAARARQAFRQCRGATLRAGREHLRDRRPRRAGLVSARGVG